MFRLSIVLIFFLQILSSAAHPKNRGESDNICNAFLATAAEMKDDEHFQMDDTERIQAKLRKYFCIKESEKNKRKDSNIINYIFDWTTIDDIQLYAEEAMSEIREKFGITYKKLADSFTSAELIALNVLGKSSSKFYRTNDEFFLLKQIPYAYEVETMEKTLKNYFDHMMKMGRESFINKIFLVFRLEIENTPTLFLLMENVFKNTKDLTLLNFDVKGVFSQQRQLVKVDHEKRLNNVVLKWYNYFGAEPPLVPEKVMPMFAEGILLDKATHRNIAERLKRDFEVLAKNNVNDWSIIFGVYFEQNGEHEKITESSDEIPFFKATCNQCRNHPNSATLLNSQKLRLYFGIVDIFTPFSEERKKRYIDGLKRHITVQEKDSANLMAYVKTGRRWEMFGPIPPSMYTERMFAFSMACAFRWKTSAENIVPSEAIRQALISAFCNSYGNSKQFDETEQQLEKAEKKKWTDLVQNVHSIGKYIVTIFGVELFKHLMEQSDKYFWNFLNDLTEDELKVTGGNYEQISQKFVVKKFGEKMVDEIFGNIIEKEPKIFALLSLKVIENGEEKCEFFEVIGQ